MELELWSYVYAIDTTVVADGAEGGVRVLRCVSSIKCVRCDYYIWSLDNNLLRSTYWVSIVSVTGFHELPRGSKYVVKNQVRHPIAAVYGIVAALS